jgi:hypothetical protein
MSRKTVRLLMDIVFVYFPIVAAILAWFIMPVTVYAFKWGSGWWEYDATCWECWIPTHWLGVLMMSIMYGIAAVGGIIYGLVRLWNWSHTEVDIEYPDNKAEGAAGDVVNE